MSRNVAVKSEPISLPIDVVSGEGSWPVQFRWKQAVHTVVGTKEVECTGSLAPSVEQAVVKLINLAKQQDVEIRKLKDIISSLTDRVAAQSESLTKKAEGMDQSAPITTAQSVGSLPERRHKR